MHFVKDCVAYVTHDKQKCTLPKSYTYIYIYFIIEIVFYRNAVFMIFTQSNMGCVVHKCLREHAKKTIYNYDKVAFCFSKKDISYI